MLALAVFFISYSLLISVLLVLFGIFTAFITVDMFFPFSATVQDFYFYVLCAIVSPLVLCIPNHQRYVPMVYYTCYLILKTVRTYARTVNTLPY